MRLSTRFTTAIIAHVVLTVAVFTALNYRVFEIAGMPGAAERFAALNKGVADELQAATAGLRPDVRALRTAPAVEGIVRAGEHGGVDPTEGVTVESWRTQLTANCVLLLAANERYRRCRLISIAADNHDVGHAMVDVEQANGMRRVLADAAPRPEDDDLIHRTLLLADGEVFVGSIQRERDGAGTIPVVNVATAIGSGEPFGMLVITMDLHDAFARVRAASTPERPFPLAALPAREVFVVDERGDYLLEPDTKIGVTSTRRGRLQDDFPGLSEESLAVDSLGPIVMNDRNGVRVAVGLAAANIAGGRRVSVLQVVPYAAVSAAKDAVIVSTAIAASVAALAAVALAIFLARSISGPLVRMAKAVIAFGHGEPMQLAGLPTAASGEIGVLATAFAGMAAEVSEKTAAMRRNAEILDVIMARMVDAVLLVDGSGSIVFANAAAKDLLGAHADIRWDAWMYQHDVYGADGATPLAPEECPVTRVIHGENVDNFEFAFRVKGEERMVHVVVSGRPIRAAAGAREGAVLVFRDVTAWKETERLLRGAQKMEAVGQLTGGIAHDFNNMLTVITGTIDILIDGVADRPVLSTIAKMISRAAARGADLTKQLLAFARKQPLEPRTTDINALISDTAKLLRPALGEAIEIREALADGAWPAMIDPTQLSTALLNLALNARDAMGRGGTLTLASANVLLDEAYVRTNPDVKPGPYVMVAVTDTGVGIPAALHEKVFEPFFTTKDIGKGTGLGLSMVYGFVKQSGGHIKIDSEEGHGTTFRLYLPRSSGEQELEPAPVVPLQGGDETILVVEDDALVRNTVIGRLKDLGYTTLAAGNAAEALARVDEGAQFDLLFTDVVMPGGMNGRELALEVAKRRPGIRVLFTSGYSENAVVHEGRLDRDVALLAKPYRQAELAQKVREALARELEPMGDHVRIRETQPGWQERVHSAS